VTDGRTGLELGRRQHAKRRKELNVLLRVESRESGGSVVKVGETTTDGFLMPLLIVVVAVVDDAQMLLEVGTSDSFHGFLGSLAGGAGSENLLGHGAERVSEDGVENHVGSRRVLGGTESTELELVAGEGEWRCAVAVSSGASDGGKSGDTEVDVEVQLRGGLVVADETLDRVVKIVTEVDGNDGRGGFVGAKAVVVASAGDSPTHEVTMMVDSTDGGGQKEHELDVRLRVSTRS